MEGNGNIDRCSQSFCLLFLWPVIGRLIKVELPSSPWQLLLLHFYPSDVQWRGRDIRAIRNDTKLLFARNCSPRENAARTVAWWTLGVSVPVKMMKLSSVLWSCQETPAQAKWDVNFKWINPELMKYEVLPTPDWAFVSFLLLIGCTGLTCELGTSWLINTAVFYLK